MFFNTKLVALVSVLLAGARASDVYATFQASDGLQVGSVSYDVGNDGCFQNQGSVKVSFSQGGIPGDTAQGPYCLTGFSGSDCSGATGNQVFQDVGLGNSQAYALVPGVQSGPFKKWTLGSC